MVLRAGTMLQWHRHSDAFWLPCGRGLRVRYSVARVCRAPPSLALSSATGFAPNPLRSL